MNLNKKEIAEETNIKYLYTMHDLKPLIISIILSFITYRFFIRFYDIDILDGLGNELIKILINKPRYIILILNFVIQYYCIKIVIKNNKETKSILKLKDFIDRINYEEVKDIESLEKIYNSVMKIMHEAINDYIDEEIEIYDMLILNGFIQAINVTTLSLLLYTIRNSDKE